MPEWDAEVAIDETLVRGLLREQFPELDAGSAWLLGEGWDNSVWVVEERWAFRFPRRSVAVPLVARELALLPRLAPLLPVPIPTPVFVGDPGDGYPWPFFGTPLLPGCEPADAELSDGERAELGAALGRFLRVLHQVEVDVELPVDPNRRADMSVRVPRTRERVSELEAAGIWDSPGRVEPVLEAALPLPPSGIEVLVHGDLHLRHVLVEGGALSGVIDWGDACRADPAVDLLVYWSLLAGDGRAAFLDAYGAVDDEPLLRARVLSISLCAMLALHARDVGNPRLERESLAALGRTLAA